MKKRNMVVISAAVYSLFVIFLFAALTAFRDNEGALTLAIYIIVSGLSVATILLAMLFIRESPSERYAERFGEDREKK